MRRIRLLKQEERNVGGVSNAHFLCSHWTWCSWTTHACCVPCAPSPPMSTVNRHIHSATARPPQSGQPTPLCTLVANALTDFGSATPWRHQCFVRLWRDTSIPATQQNLWQRRVRLQPLHAIMITKLSHWMPASAANAMSTVSAYARIAVITCLVVAAARAAWHAGTKSTKTTKHHSEPGDRPPRCQPAPSRPMTVRDLLSLPAESTLCVLLSSQCTSCHALPVQPAIRNATCRQLYYLVRPKHTYPFDMPKDLFRGGEVAFDADLFPCITTTIRTAYVPWLLHTSDTTPLRRIVLLASSRSAGAYLRVVVTAALPDAPACDMCGCASVYVARKPWRKHHSACNKTGHAVCDNNEPMERKNRDDMAL